jgi:competence protein ComEC
VSASDPGRNPDGLRLSGRRDRCEATAGPDLRLLPLAASLWLAQGLVLIWQPTRPLSLAGMGVTLLALVLAVAAAGRLMNERRAASDRFRGRTGAPGAPTLVAVLVGLGLGMALGGLHTARLHPAVVADVTTQSAVVRVDARITGDPAVHWPAQGRGGSTDPSWTLAARVTTMTARGITHRLAIPVVLRGESVRRLSYGARVRLTGRAESAWAPETASMAITVLGEVQVRSPPGRLAGATNRIRASFRGATQGLPPDAAALLLGLAVGDESLVGPDLDRAMIRAGLAHLTAVSGSNTALVVGMAMAGAVAMGWGWRARVLGSVLVLAGYVALVRPQPSVLRAAGMGLVALLALTAGGRRRGPPALLAVVILLLVGWPQFAISIGFGLSVAATAGLLLVGPWIAERLGRWPGMRRAPEPLRAALAVAAAAHMATLPLAVLLGNGASLVALPANVVVTPLVPFATVVGLAAALVSPFVGTAAGLLAHIAAPATATIAWVAHMASELPYGVIEIPGGAVPALATTLVGALCVVVARRGARPWRDRRVLSAVAVALAAVLLVRWAIDRRWPPPDWVVLACDVGQGDGILVRQPGSADALLVDTGPADGGIVGCLRDAGVRPVAILLTHFHADHVDGLEAVLSRWDVPVILTTPSPEPLEGSAAVSALGAASSTPVRTVQAGDRLAVADMTVDALWPARRIAQSPANNASVVAVVQVPAAAGSVRVLLTGDIEPAAQVSVMAGAPPDVDVVKVPHHGSRHQDPRFARWASAQIALVSAGADNDYGHPSPTTLGQYRTAGARIGRTDTQGALAVRIGPQGPELVVQR